MFHDFSRLPDFFKVKTKPDMGGLKYRPVVSLDENASEEIHETLKLTAFLPLKIHGWKMKFPFRECLFSHKGYMSRNSPSRRPIEGPNNITTYLMMMRSNDVQDT